MLDSGISTTHPDPAGRVAQSADFTGSGIVGLSQARLFDAKVLDDSGVGTESEMLKGIGWATDQGARG